MLIRNMAICPARTKYMMLKASIAAMIKIDLKLNLTYPSIMGSSFIIRQSDYLRRMTVMVAPAVAPRIASIIIVLF
mgnify:CR=1 FL=1